MSTAAIFQRSDWVEFDRVFKVVRGEVGIAHGQLDIGVAEDPLQHQDVAAPPPIIKWLAKV